MGSLHRLAAMAALTVLLAPLTPASAEPCPPDEQVLATSEGSGVGGTGYSGEGSGVGGTGVSDEGSGVGGTGILGTVSRTEGFCVNGLPVQATEIKHGDRIEIGTQCLTLVIEEREIEPDVYEIQVED